MIPVDVVLDGRLVLGSQSARVSAGVVEAPLDPYVRDLATTIVIAGRRITLGRSDRTFVLFLGSRHGRVGTTATTLPIAPYLRAGATIIPLAATARALGATVRYEAASHTVTIETTPLPLTTFTPSPRNVPDAGPFATFSPTSTPLPQPSVTGIPMPRRTPILIDPSLGD